MKLCCFLMIGLVLAGSSSCSYDETRKTEMAVEKSVEDFHAEMNAERYQELYEQADPELRGHLSLEEFTAQLRAAHDQVGPISNKAYVIIDDGLARAIRRTFNGGWERVTYGTVLGNDKLLAHEKFIWTVQRDQPKLASYEFRTICYKPCSIGIVGP